ncbi:MAG: peptide chain release factor N(5)-glutamine methyltransferase [Phycisphaerales bacterium]
MIAAGAGGSFAPYDRPMTSPAPPGHAARAAGDAEPWTTRRLLAWITSHFAAKGVEAPRVCAEMLMAQAFACERLRLYMEVDRPASPDELERLRGWVKRVAAHEPVQFVVGEAWFFGRAFQVSPATLVPRPATETLVEAAVTHLRQLPAEAPRRLLDLCTGSGCLGLSTVATLTGARKLPQESAPPPRIEIRAVLTDAVPAAAELAGRNAARHGLEPLVEIRVGDLWEALAPGERGSFHVISANPPYVADGEWDSLPDNVRLHEPATALRGGPDGLDVVRRILAEAHAWAAPTALLLVEIGDPHAEAALQLARTAPGWERVSLHCDHEGLPRMLRLSRGADATEPAATPPRSGPSGPPR